MPPCHLTAPVRIGDRVGTTHDGLAVIALEAADPRQPNPFRCAVRPAPDTPADEPHVVTDRTAAPGRGPGPGP